MPVFHTVYGFQCDTMPRQPKQNNKKNKNFKRRKGRKQINNGMAPLRVMRTNNTIMPDELETTLAYNSVAQLAPGAITYEYAFAGNGMFDPDITLVGGQPNGFDEMSVFYARYRVLSSKIVARFVNTASVGTIISVTPYDTSAGSTATNDSSTSPYSRWNVVANANGINEKTIINQMRSDRIFGTKITQDDLFAATFSANPTNLWYWIINFDSTANLQIMMNVVIYYKVRFYKRVPLNLSTAQAKPARINVIDANTVPRHKPRFTRQKFKH